MDKYQKQLRAIETEMREVLGSAKSITERAREDGRAPTDEERREINRFLQKAEVLKEKKAEVDDAIAVGDRVESLGRSIRIEEPQAVEAKTAATPGEIFVKSQGYNDLRNSGFSGGRWSTGLVEVTGSKALLSTSGAGAETAGGALIQPQVAPGILGIASERLTIADLMGSIPVSSNTYRYLVETTATNGATAVAEAGEKPESTLEFDDRDEPVRKIATLLPVTDEMLDDVPALQAYINQRLVRFIREKEEDSLLNGAGTPDLDGLLGRVPTSNPDHADVYSDVADANMADHIFHGLSLVRQDAFVEPNGIVIHPADWEALRLLKDEALQYFGGGPFSGAYGNGAFQNYNSLWGKPVVVTSAITEGTALVGSFSEAAVLRKGGIAVEASNSHDDFFAFNKTAIRAEERLGLAVFRPAAFATVDLNGAVT